MKIDNVKSVKIQSQQAFRGEKAQDKEEETQNGSGKILLALAGLAALGGGAYLLLKKDKVTDETKDTIKDVIKDPVAEAKEAARKIEKTLNENFDKLKEHVHPKTTDNLERVVAVLRDKMSKPVRTLNLVAKDTDDARELAKGIANSAGYEFREFAPKGKTPEECLFERVRLLSEATQKFEKTGQKTVVFSPDAETTYNFVSADSKLLSEVQRAELGAILGEEKDIRQNKDAVTLIIASDKKVIYDELTPVVYSKNVDEANIFGRSQEAFDKDTEEFAPLLEKYSIKYLEHLGEKFRESKAFGTNVPYSIQIDAATNAQAKDIARLLPEYLMADKSTLTTRQRHPKRLLQSIKNAADVREEIFQETGKREILHLGDLSQIFDEAKKKFSDKKYLEFVKELHHTAMSLPDKGMSVSYTISDKGKVPLENRVMDCSRIVAKGSTYDTRVHYKTMDPKVTEDAISSISEHLSLKSTSKLRILAKQFNEMHKNGYSSKLRGSLIVQRPDKQASAAIVAKLPEITGAKLVKLDVDAHLGELEEYVINKVNEAEMHHEKTGQTTLLHIVTRGGNNADNKAIDTIQKHNFHKCMPVIETTEKELPETLSDKRRIQI